MVSSVRCSQPGAGLCSRDVRALRDVRVHPRLEELYRGEPGQTPDGVIDLAGRRAPVPAAEEIARHEAELLPGLHADAHGRPEAIQEEARRPRHHGPLQPDLRLTIVEEEVARLVDDDALEEIREHGVT